MKILLDTGPLVALLNQRDSYHTWSVENAGKLKPPFYTCEAVLAEAHFLLGGTGQGRQQLIRLLDSGRIVLSNIVKENLGRVGELMDVYSNVPMGFADSCLTCMAEHSGGTVFTLDSDFHIYRINKNKAISLIIP
jgi:uncharacterized protein